MGCIMIPPVQSYPKMSRIRTLTQMTMKFAVSLKRAVLDKTERLIAIATKNITRIYNEARYEFVEYARENNWTRRDAFLFGVRTVSIGIAGLSVAWILLVTVGLIKP